VCRNGRGGGGGGGGLYVVLMGMGRHVRAFLKEWSYAKHVHPLPSPLHPFTPSPRHPVTQPSAPPLPLHADELGVCGLLPVHRGKHQDAGQARWLRVLPGVQLCKLTRGELAASRVGPGVWAGCVPLRPRERVGGCEWKGVNRCACHGGLPSACHAIHAPLALHGTAWHGMACFCPASAAYCCCCNEQ
jgi:hypothetical protein